MIIDVGNIYDFLCSRFPLDKACDFDNLGLLVGDCKAQVKKTVVALDCDINTVKIAVQNNCQLIITHHPVIFNGLKSVLAGSVVYECIKNGISVISMHTNLDVAEGGVNDCLCRSLGFTCVSPFTATDGFVLRSAEVDGLSADAMAQHIKQSLGTGVRYSASDDRIIKKVLICSGSGGDFLSDAVFGGFDALITADVKHNVFIDAVNYGISVFDAGHYATENIIVSELCELLSQSFKSVEFLVYNSEAIRSI